MVNAPSFRLPSNFKLPLAKDDGASGTEDRIGYIAIIDLMANDKGGGAVTFYGIGQTDPAIASTTGLTALGATIRVLADGTISYDPTDPVAAARLQGLSAGTTIDDTFT